MGAIFVSITVIAISLAGGLYFYIQDKKEKNIICNRKMEINY